jgi:hypothetical protein
LITRRLFLGACSAVFSGLAVFAEEDAVFLVVMAWSLIQNIFAIYCSATHSKDAKGVQN